VLQPPEHTLKLLVPEVILAPEALREVRLLLRKSAHAWKRYTDSRYKEERHREAGRRIHGDISAICEKALARKVGLKKFMVIEVTDADGRQTKLQYLGVSVYRDVRKGRMLRWSLTGRSVRMDGTLGKNDESCVVLYDAIRRRKLDGTWVYL
jgi:hypothetical protein